MSLLIFTIPACLAEGTVEPVTMDSLLRQYCSERFTLYEAPHMSVNTAIYGQFGPRGFRGETGIPGIPGGVGCPGTMNDTVIREYFLENLETGTFCCV